LGAVGLLVFTRWKIALLALLFAVLAFIVRDRIDTVERRRFLAERKPDG